VTAAALPWIDFNLYLITDRKQVRGGLLAVVEEALRGGVRAVQLREKDLSSRECYELAYEMRKLTARHDALLFINDRIDIAMAVDADGVHLGGDSLPIHRVRKLLGEKKLIGVSCHNQISAVTAQDRGADFITFGPIYSTPSKIHYGAPVGVDRLRKITAPLRIPVFALGGVKPENVPELVGAGVYGISVISAIIAAEEPQKEARSLLSLLPPMETPDI
jgi:thiamine-phosphate pyrophosphorylase